MVVNLELKHGATYLKIKDGNTYRTSNNINKIVNYLKYLPKNFSKCVIKNGNMYLHLNNCVLVLHDYMQNIQNREFSYIINSVDSNIPVVDMSKVKKINTGLISLALCFTIIGASVVANKDNKDKVVPYTEISALETPSMEMSEKPSTPVLNYQLGSGINEYTNMLMHNFISSSYFKYFLDNSESYNFDPYLLLAISLTESSLDHDSVIPGGANYNGSATGIMQIENSNIGSTVKAHNYKTNTDDSILITNESVLDIESNIKIGSMLFQNCLDKYKGNIYLTIQSYNYGTVMMDIIINKYAEEINSTYDEVINNYNDLGWLKYVSDVHNNPKNYISNWQYDTYGSDKYIDIVLGYYMGDMLVSQEGLSI